MTDNATKKRHARSAKAVFLATCMLLCAMVPMVTSMDDDSSVYADGETINYVSLGDSMVSGFGLDGYHDDNPAGGFLKILGDNVGDTPTYSYLVSKYLEEQGFDVDLKQLAISGMRTADLRLLIDDGFTGEVFSVGGDPYSVIGKEYGDFEALSEFYKTTLANADLITYQFHFDFSLPLAQSFYGLMGEDMGYDFNLYPYIDQDVLNSFVAIQDMLFNGIYDLLSESGLDAEAFASVVDMVYDFVKPVLYAIISYCSNFDANMEIILGMNPDAKIIVVENDSSIPGLDAVIAEIAGVDVVLDVSTFLDMVFNIVNLYTGYLSPYSFHVYQVDASNMSMGEEFTSGGVITNDAKNGFMTELTVPPGFELDINPEIPTDGYLVYDEIDAYGNLTHLIAEVFDDVTLYLDDFKAGGSTFDDIAIGVELKLITLVGDASDGFASGYGYLARDDVVFQDLPDGSLQISCGEGTVTLDTAEMFILWLNYYLFKLSHIMGHFSPYIQVDISEEVIDCIEENGLFDEVAAEPLGAPVALGAQAPAVNGTLLDLVVDTGADLSGITYADAVAEALGLDLHDLTLPDISRADEIAYLLGVTDIKDGYTDFILDRYCAGTGMTIDEVRDMFQQAVVDSDVVLLNISTYNIVDCVIQIESILSGYSPGDVDLSKFGLLPGGMSDRLQEIIGQLEVVLTQLMAGQPELLEAVEDTVQVAENIASTVLSYVLSYEDIVERIQELNPDVEIIVAGPYNVIDGLVYQTEGVGLTIDIGAIGQILTNASNAFYEAQFSDMDNVTFLDLSFAYQNDDIINVADFTGIEDFFEVFVSASLGEDEIGAVVDGALGAVAGNIYTATFEYDDGSTTAIDFLFGESIVGPELPTRAGYIASWNAPATMPASDVYATIVWTPITYSIVYDANGGVGADVVVDYTYDVSGEVESSLFDRNGFDFIGWNTAVDGSGTAYAAGDEVLNLLDTDGASITLYAQWEESTVHGEISATSLAASAVIIIAVLAFGALLYYRRD